MTLAGQLQTSPGCKVGGFHLADDGDDTGRAQGVLEDSQGLGLVAHTYLDQAFGRKTEARETRGVEIVAAQDPHHLAALAERRGQQGDKGGGGRGGLDLHPLAARFVPATKRQAPAWQTGVDAATIAERQGRPPRGSLQNGELPAHGFETRLARHPRVPFVLFLF